MQIVAGGSASLEPGEGAPEKVEAKEEGGSLEPVLPPRPT
jgi:hypothetical protein